MRSLRIAPFVLLLAAGACADSGRIAMGDVNSVIVVADSGLWAEVSDTVMSALQPRIFAVRAEPTFKLTHVSPIAADWPELRRFRQVLAIGRASDPWVRDVLAEADTTVSPPAVVQTTDVWARNQLAAALVVPESSPAEAVRRGVPDLADALHARYRRWAQRRMFTSGADTMLADTLAREGGFTLTVPNVYTFRREPPNGFLAFNDQAAGTPLVRSIYVTWRSGTAGEPTAESALAWRDSVGQAVYDWPQRSEREPVRVRRLDEPGGGGIEVRGVWTGTEDETFPQAGAFLTRVVDCPSSDRRYLIDAWLYAPATDKYQYVIQLETLLDGFECGAA